MGMADSIGARALRFLDAQKLDHSPEHYAFAYRYLAGVDREFSDAVDREIEGGVRLRTEAVRALMPEIVSPLTDGTFDRLTIQLLELLTRELAPLHRVIVITANDAHTLLERILGSVKDSYWDASIGKAHRNAATHSASAYNPYTFHRTQGRIVRHIRNLHGSTFSLKCMAHRLGGGTGHKRDEDLPF